MNVVNFNERSCEKYRRYFDAYLDNELLVETNQDVLQHLTFCAECNRMLEDRSRVKRLVREAVTREGAPPELLSAVRNQLPQNRPGVLKSNAARWAMAAAAILLLAVLAGRGSQWFRFPGFGGNGGVLQTVSAGARDLLRVGLIDHLHCAILSQRWKRFVSFDDMKADTGRQSLGSEFIGLVPAVQSKLGSGYKLVQGHRCTADNRQYIHLILTGDKGTILSLVITEKKNESFLQADAVAVMKAQGISIYEDRQGILEVAGFESDKYLAYVVSNLDRDVNLKIASLVAPQVYEHLHRLEL
jgi:hypothetical protein